MKKQLNTEGITNELAGASLFFNRQKRSGQHLVNSTPRPEQAQRQEGQEKEEQQKSSSVPVPEPVPVGVGVRVGVSPSVSLIPKVKRVIKQRQPFDIYEDQYQRLKQIKEAEEGFVNGRGMSQMVREAIDTYLRDHGTPRKE
jgi:hypothetical protein